MLIVKGATFFIAFKRILGKIESDDSPVRQFWVELLFFLSCNRLMDFFFLNPAGNYSESFNKW